MNKDEFNRIQAEIVMITGLVNKLKLQEFLSEIVALELSVPSSDLYLRGECGFEKIKGMATEMIYFRNAVRSLLSGGCDAQASSNSKKQV